MFVCLFVILFPVQTLQTTCNVVFKVLATGVAKDEVAYKMILACVLKEGHIGLRAVWGEAGELSTTEVKQEEQNSELLDMM